MATSKKSVAATVTKTVTANVPITYNDVDVAVGETFDCTEAELVQLLEVSAVTVNDTAAAE